MAIHADIVEEGERLAQEARRRGVLLKLLGGVAVHLSCPSARRPPLKRPYADLDFATRLEDSARVQQLLAEEGYLPRRTFNALHGHQRLYFADPDRPRHLDIFIDRLRMNHLIDLRHRLSGPALTIPAAELLLSKLQVVDLTAKDAKDLLAILSDQDLAESDEKGIHLGRLSGAVSHNWGLYRTATENLRHISELVSRFQDIDPGALLGKIERLLARLERAPRSLRFRLRALVGERLRWYETPESVDRTETERSESG